jgi:hypothetical protein
MDEQERQRNDTFDFIVRRALEPEYQPDYIEEKTVVQSLGLQEAKKALLEQKRKWLEHCKEQKKQEDPIERYCYDIRCEIPDYEKSFEERQKEIEESWQMREATLKEEQDAQTTWVKPEGMTNKEWSKEKRKTKRLKREERNQEEADQVLKQQSPHRLFRRRVDKIGCRCEAEEMRRGIFCETCKLIRRINEYTLDLFKNASQGRTAF